MNLNPGDKAIYTSPLTKGETTFIVESICPPHHYSNNVSYRSTNMNNYDGSNVRPYNEALSNLRVMLGTLDTTAGMVLEHIEDEIESLQDIEDSDLYDSIQELQDNITQFQTEQGWI